MKCSLLGGLAVAAISATASADVVISFANFAANGFQFSQIAAPGQLTGTLTGVSVNAVLNSSVGFTYADDLCVYIDVLPLSTTGMVQIGGYSDLGAAQRYFWPSGGSDAVGTAVTGDITFITPVNMSTPNLAIWLGNGYGAAGTSGNWTGSITLIGVTQVPTPGALALLALAGVVSRRRR